MAERRSKEEGRRRNRVRVSLAVAEELGRGLVLLVSLLHGARALRKKWHIFLGNENSTDREHAEHIRQTIFAADSIDLGIPLAYDAILPNLEHESSFF